MKLYDLLVEGYHTPLTASEIAERFHAGRLLRDDPCKEVGKTAWRTIDELFPLLKYDSSAGMTAGSASASIYGPTTNGAFVTRRAVLIGTLVALFVVSSFLVGPDYFASNGKPISTSIRTQATAKLPVDPNRLGSVSSGIGAPGPTIYSTGAYASEQTYRTAQLRQEERERQLEQTKLAERHVIEERSRAQQQRAQSQKSAEREFSLPLGTYTSLNVGGYRHRIAVHDDGPDEIRVIVDYGRPVRFQKRSGFEGRDIETLIFSNGSAHLYYVNTISDHVGHCTLRLRDE